MSSLTPFIQKQSSEVPLISKLDKEFSANALPYFDKAFTKEEKIAANKMLDEEMKRFPKVKNYLADLPMESEKLLTPALKELLSIAAENRVMHFYFLNNII